MLKEKFESVKKFVSDHKVELAIGGLTAALGATVLYQHKVNVSMAKLHKNETELHKKEVDMIELLLTSVAIFGEGVVMANEDIDALAKHNGLTIEDVWKIGFETKEALAETCKDLIED